MTFGINFRNHKYTLLRTNLLQEREKYWKESYNGYYICSQWYQNCASNFAKWLIYLSNLKEEQKPVVIKPQNNPSFNDMKETKKTVSTVTTPIDAFVAKRAVSPVNGNCKFTKQDGTVVYANEKGMRNPSLPWANENVELYIYVKEQDLISDWRWSKIE
jgi:hypothetical protein